MQIQDLELFPLRLAKDGTKERLKERGLKFWDFRIRKYVSYLSDSIESGDQAVSFCILRSEGQLVLTANEMKPRYMIDMRTYHELHQTESSSIPEVAEAIPMTAGGGSVPDDSFLLLLPATILGFGLHDKKWITLIVDKIKDIEWNSRAFGKLVLGHQKKEIIKALVTVHVASGKKPTTDIIEGKGNGLIMLLHGSPGTGKTLTAESIAEFTEKPLYRVTCGDIGTDPETVEKYLESVLYIGTVWGCVVLLDEADVFLEERSQSDLQRNALVSVFLRVLEYYDGILIFTSNRVGTFDEAFKSRIQLAIHYPRLDTAGRSKIWYGFINDLEKRGLTEDPASLRSSVPALADKPLNGRQIRNTVKNARQYAEYKKEPLNTEHFEAVVEVANEFEEYLKRIVDHTEQASFLGTRAPE
ncbi:Lon protease-like protein [Lasiodiplodia hormozganensis]|uniref:Lon protease-like protein n=1 Tax=Lasiodiplodia hormozganensis TaxID=869390 RepID=A0AA40C5N7_9PEZI|nr:Lon protease-like protein [Lasiodiplodia hormozganensis]